MPKSYGERIDKLKEQREQIERRFNTLEQKATNEKWKRDTRRKIIVGGAVLAEMQIDAEFAHVIQGLLARYVGRPSGSSLKLLALVRMKGLDAIA
jgi:hypothetical protein